MSAIIRTGGKQYRVDVGQHIVIERLAGEAGDPGCFDEVLSTGDGADIKIGTPTLAGVSVHGTIVEQKRGRKILVFRRKRRKNFRRLNGHRQYQSVVEITAIGGSAPKAVKAAESKPKTKTTEKAKKAEASPQKETTLKKTAGSDKLTAINGIGPAIEKKLAAIGFTTLKQIAEMTEAQKASVDEQLNFKGRIDREEWVKQAKELVK